MRAINISWCTDDAPVTLPTEVIIPKGIHEEAVADWLSDQYGFLINSFSIDHESIPAGHPKNRQVKTILLRPQQASFLQKILHEEPTSEADCFGEDEKFSMSVSFDDGRYAFIDCCGVQYREDECNTAWTQGMLYEPNGRAIACTEPGDEFLGEWLFTDNQGREYCVNVAVAQGGAL